MSTHHHPDQNGALSSESTPQVVVRAGKHYVCSSCGTWVEIPADVVGMLVIAPEPQSQSTEAQQETSTSEGVASVAAPTPSKNVAVETNSSRSTSDKTNPRRPTRPQQPPKPGFVGETIDGLRVPSSQELDRAFEWVTFHLKILDRLDSEIKRLKKRSNVQASCARPRAAANESPDKDAPTWSNSPREGHAPEPTDIASEPKRAKGREPP